MPLARMVEASEAGRRSAEKRARVLDACRRLQNDPPGPLFDRIESTVRLQALAEEWEEQIALLEEAREAIRHRLCSGELLACGFVGNSDQPQQLAAVPPEMWHHPAQIDWDGGGVARPARAFVDVRVIPRPQGRLHGDDAPAPTGSRLAD
jgi:hypothetical protein